LQSTNHETLNDERRLVRLGLKGDQAALEALFGRHSGALYQSALKLLGNPQDAEDALQEGMLSAFKNLRRFEGRSKFSSWLTRIVINAALQRLRSQRAHQTISADERLGNTEVTLAEQLPDPEPDPERLYAREELRQLLDRNLTRLAPDMRSAVLLRDLEGLSTQEAAEALGVPENTLKSRLHRARLQLRERIESRAAAQGAKDSRQVVMPVACCS
jgi:RNA polymerase sigma-70 factor (ECF subfamily)